MDKNTKRAFVENVEKTDFSEQMQKSYIDYSMSVITQRALPDVRDGLKPVQRHILYDMETLRTHSDKPHRKCARIVGDTMGKFHPHGDSSIYESLVNMAQPFKRRTPIVDGHGNFGSIEGDGAAAMRYTEARLLEYAEDAYLQDIDSTVEFIPNFDGSEKEPEVLPSRVPLFVQGSEGIAVGMATSIPSHNLTESLEAAKAYIKNNNISTEALMEKMPGPDFPTGGIIVNKSVLAEIYETGMGKIRIRAKLSVEEGTKKTDRIKLIIDEIPYTMVGNGISAFFGELKKLVEGKQFPELMDLRNESNGDDIRIIMELKSGSDIERIENMLYKKTRLEDTIGVKFLAVANKRPEVLNLKEMLKYYTEFQYEINEKKYKALLDKALGKKEIQEGLIKACDVIDLIIEIIRGSKSIKEAKDCLINGNTEPIKFKSKKSEIEAKQLLFTSAQAAAILEMQLSKLIGLEIIALQNEHKETLNRIAKYNDILNNPDTMKKTIIAEINRLQKKYPQKRLTKITEEQIVEYKEKVIEQDLYVLVDRFAYVKTIDAATYERNKETIYQEYVYSAFCKSTDRLYFFADSGERYMVKCDNIPFGKLRDKAVPLGTLSTFNQTNETILYVVPEMELQGLQLVFITKNAMIKRIFGEELVSRKKAMSATKFKIESDRLIFVSDIGSITGDIYKTNIVLHTKGGYFNRFTTEDIVLQKRNSSGTEGIKIKKNDELEGVVLFSERDDDPIVDYNGKEVHIKRLKFGSRGSGGIKNR